MHVENPHEQILPTQRYRNRADAKRIFMDGGYSEQYAEAVLNEYGIK